MFLATTTGDFNTYFPELSASKKKIQLLHKCGFKYIDLSMYRFEPDSPFYCDGWERYVDELAEEAQRLGMTFVQAHSLDITTVPGELQDKQKECFFRQLDICKRLGIPSTVIHASTAVKENQEQFIARNKLFYSELLKEAEKREFNVLTENTCAINNPFYYILTANDFYLLNEALNKHPLFGICWDIGHAHIQNVNQYEQITELKDRLKAIHIHDNMGNNDTHAVPYLGTIAYDEIINALIDNGFKGAFTMDACSSFRPTICRKSFGDDRLISPPLDLQVKMEEILFLCGKHLLEAYNLFEE